MKGASTCLAPSIINVKKLATNIQKNNFDIGLKANPLKLEESAKGNTKSTKIAANIKITPKSLLGIERNIA